MRITSGIFKNRRILSPERNALIRPTTDKVRAAFFSSVGSLENARFLDVFSGTGAVGIEAYSRGASHVTFLEKDAAILKKNLALMPKDSYTVINYDFFKYPLKGEFDTVYIDPPYGVFNPVQILEKLSNLKFGIMGYEESVKTDFSNTQFEKERVYGDSKIVYFRQQ